MNRVAAEIALGALIALGFFWTFAGFYTRLYLAIFDRHLTSERIKKFVSLRGSTVALSRWAVFFGIVACGFLQFAMIGGAVSEFAHGRAATIPFAAVLTELVLAAGWIVLLPRATRSAE
jgi:hypothetical protein